MNHLNCWIRACKHNHDGICGKYCNVDEMLEDFDHLGGCAFTWFFSGQLPKLVINHKLVGNHESSHAY